VNTSPIARAAHLAAWAVVIISGLALAGWLLDIPALTSIVPGQVTMKFNTALGLILAGVALLRRQPRLTRVVSAINILLGGLTLAEYLFGWNLGIDEWLVREIIASPQLQPPGRMSFVSAVNLCLIGSSLLLLPRRPGLAQGLALVIGLLGLLSLTGYLYGVHYLYTLVAFSAIAVHTAAAFILISLSLFFADPTRGLAAVIMSGQAGGILARWLLPIAVALPVILGWLRLEGQQVGLYDTEFGTALLTLATLILFSIFIFWVARSLNALDSQRAAAMQALRQARDELEARVRSRTSELAAANEALAASQRTLRFHASLQAAVTDAVIATDLDFIIQSWNAAAERIYGWRAEEVIGQSAAEVLKTVFPPGTPVDQILRDFTQHGYWTGEVIQRHKDGTPIHILGSTVPFNDEHGRPVGIVAVNHDISIRKRAEEALRLSEERYRSLSSVLWDYACSYRYLTDDEARLEWVVGAFEEITGHSIEDALANFSLSLPVHPDDQEIFRRRHQKLRAGHDDISEFRIINARGEARWVRSYGRPEWDAAHERVIRVYIGVQDISERKRAEEALAEERSRLRVLIDTLPDYIYIKDLRHRFVLGNVALAQAVGVASPDAIIGTTDSDYAPPELAASFYADDNTVFQTGQPVVDREERTLGQNGAIIWASTTKVPLRSRGGEIIGLVGITRDITLRKQFEQELEDARLRAEEANRLKTEFLATMSHELRTPLNAIIGFSDAMLHNLAGTLDERQREYMSIILNNGEHLLALINTILDISKIEAGQFALKNAPVHLAPLLDLVRHTFQNMAAQKGIRLLTSLDPALPPVIISDELRLKQILINLVGNAIKFTEAGTVKVCILKHSDTLWDIVVTDTGIGIPPEALDLVFERFRQVDNSTSRLYGGSGLGLAIVRELSQLMGGSASVESAVQQGSTFTVTLPLITGQVE
jgi:PAS domain S-box-containing protein